MVHVARRLLASCVSHFFDDYPFTEPEWSAKSSQLFVGVLHDIVGLSFSFEKHVLSRDVDDYLGIQNDFSHLHVDGIVQAQLARLVSLSFALGEARISTLPLTSLPSFPNFSKGGRTTSDKLRCWEPWQSVYRWNNLLVT